jgi:hypothetical protein
VAPVLMSLMVNLVVLAFDVAVVLIVVVVYVDLAKLVVVGLCRVWLLVSGVFDAVAAPHNRKMKDNIISRYDILFMIFFNLSASRMINIFNDQQFM